MVKQSNGQQFLRQEGDCGNRNLNVKAAKSYRSPDRSPQARRRSCAGKRVSLRSTADEAYPVVTPSTMRLSGKL
jgi:hypothetical protein